MSLCSYLASAYGPFTSLVDILSQFVVVLCPFEVILHLFVDILLTSCFCVSFCIS